VGSIAEICDRTHGATAWEDKTEPMTMTGFLPSQSLSDFPRRKSISGSSGETSPPFFTFSATPTTVAPFTRLPIGSSPGKMRAAMSLLMTTTDCEEPVSCSVNPRPRTMGIFSAEK